MCINSISIHLYYLDSIRLFPIFPRFDANTFPFSSITKHISNIETGVRGPSLEMLIMIANVLDVSADDLLTDNRDLMNDLLNVAEQYLDAEEE